MSYAVTIEKGETSYGAYVPELPGCVAVAETKEEVEALIKEAIQFRLEMLQEEGIISLEGALLKLAYSIKIDEHPR